RLRNPKVEKAEILQKTVHFLRDQPHSEPSAMEELFLRRFHSGYRECLARAARFLQAIPVEPPCPGHTGICPPPQTTTGPIDTPGAPPGHHGLPAPRLGLGYHCYRPGCQIFR
ncbi:HES2 factor, partial [Galbula dea]|nr:HES2 factor [Galbula dea]